MNKESKASSAEEMAFAISLFENFLFNIGFRLKEEEKDYYAEENPVFRDYLIHLGKQRKVAYSTELHQEWRECLTAAVYISPLLEVEFEETQGPVGRCEKEIDPILKQGVAMNRALLGSLIKNYLKDNDLTITALALASGVSREQIGWLITGNRDPRLNTLLRVLVAMKNTLLIEVEE
jgi:DNA-binding phage protein